MNHGTGEPIDRADLLILHEEDVATYKGQRLPIKLLPLKVLACIHEQHPAMVSNEHLRRSVWNSTDVDPNLPQQQVSKANKVLPGFGLYIHSTTGKGYHIARVERVLGLRSSSQKTAGDRIPGQEGLPDDQKSKIVAHTTWKPSTIALSHAERSITIVDSFYSEYWDLGPCIMAKAEELKVSVYMVSPNTDFGAQRLREMDRAGKEDRACAANFRKSISATERKSYRHRFDECVRGLAMIAKDTPVRLRIYEYFAMPSTRIIAVDDRHFFFGWFPLWAYNPGYVCLYLEDNGLSKADGEVLRRLRQQIKSISVISRLCLSSPTSANRAKKA